MVDQYSVMLGYKGTLSSSNAMQPDEETYKWAGEGNLSSDAYQVQFSYMPWLNTQVSLQYTAYAKLNDTTKNAEDNNQLMLGGWVVF